MVGLGIFGFVLGGVASFFCLCTAVFVALIEYDGWQHDRATKAEQVPAVDIQALDDELEAIFALPSAAGSLSFRPAKPGHNRLHRGF